MAGETYSISIGKEAKSQLRNIVQYLIEHVSEQTADYVEAGIFNTIEGLRFMPTSFMIYHENPKKNIVYRRALKWKYVIIFNVNEADKIVEVAYIVHSAQDPKRIKDELSGL